MRKSLRLLPYDDQGTTRYRIILNVTAEENPGGWGKELLIGYHLSFGRLWAHGKNGFHIKKAGT